MSNEIVKMPIDLKRKLIRLNKLLVSASELDKEIQNDLSLARVPYDNLVAITQEEPVTESLAYINNAECVTKDSLNDAIKEIERVYVHFANIANPDFEW